MGTTGFTTMATWEESAGGVIPSGAGRRLLWSFDGGCDGKSKLGLIAAAGGGGMPKDVFPTGAEGGGRDSTRLGIEDCVVFSACGTGETNTGFSSEGDSGEVVAEDASGSLELVCRGLRSSNHPPTPKSSSSSSSRRFSLMMLPFVVLLAMDPVRFRAP
jgi:hypothetical protein